MSAGVKGVQVIGGDVWYKELARNLFHRWRYKLGMTLFFVPMSLGVYYFAFEWLSQVELLTEFVVGGNFAYTFLFYIVSVLFIVWFGPVRAEVSDSFLEIDLRRKNDNKRFRPKPLCSNQKTIAVLVAEGQVKYYPINLVPKDITLEEYVGSQQAEVDRLTVPPSEMSELAKIIDMGGMLKPRRTGASLDIERVEESITPVAEKIEKPVYVSAFVTSIENVIKSLDFQIETAEQKASNLLDVGRKYLKNGIYCYAVSIVIWQFVLNHLDYKWNWGIGAGVISCAVAFIVVEFLAAWFLKQYRHYGDSVQTYMMVRSVYERHLLSYYAIEEFSEFEKDNEVCRAAMLKALSEEIKWPELKEVNANDFNYMVKSFDSVSNVLEKLRVMSGKPEQRPGA